MFKLLFVILASAAAACVGSGTAQYSATATYETPDLVYVSPGVQVVADYDESIFFSDGFYWRYDNGGWYRSNNYAGGFVYWESPPSAVISIGQPERFRHYRPTGYVAQHRATVRPEPIVRDHRQVRNERVEQPTPVVRDHREPMPPEQRREEPMRREEPARPEPPRAEPRREEPRQPERPTTTPRQPPARDKHVDDKKKHEH